MFKIISTKRYNGLQKELKLLRLIPKAIKNDAIRIGDEVNISWLNGNDSGKVTSRPFYSSSILTTDLTEKVMVKIGKTEIAVWTQLLNKIERK